MSSILSITYTPDGKRDAYTVKSSSGKTYLVRYEGSGDGDPDFCALWSCTCPAGEFRQLCHHEATVASLDFDDMHGVRPGDIVWPR